MLLLELKTKVRLLAGFSYLVQVTQECDESYFQISVFKMLVKII